MSQFTPSGSGGLVNSVTVVAAGTPTVVNVGIPLANTEVSYMLPPDTKRFYIQIRDSKTDLKLAYSVGTSGTSYVTVHRGTWYGEEDLDLSSVTLYFQTTAASQTAEIVSWA